MNTQLLIFDLDGTLIDTMGDYADKAAALIFDHYGTPRDEARRRYFETSGLPFEQQLEQMFPREPCNIEVAQMFESWKDGYLLNVSLSSETEQLLCGWRNAGFRIAISSNNLEPYVQRLAAYWPVDAALGYRSKDDFGKGEPHFQNLEEHFGFSREKMIFIGDSPNDARFAAHSKVPFLALLTGEFAEADFTQYSPGVKCIARLSDLNASLHDGRLIGVITS
jgi:phosphoglycolate phosphatase